jgi:hypothetical protein
MSDRREFLKLILTSAAVLTANRALPLDRNWPELVKAGEAGWYMGLLELHDGVYRELVYPGNKRQLIEWLPAGGHKIEQRMTGRPRVRIHGGWFPHDSASHLHARAVFGPSHGNGHIHGAAIYRDGREVARVVEGWGVKTSTQTWEITIPVVVPT